ncbi:MAG: hypothetical protein R3D57_09930 [Hyphomicrobiaceae bacterium]
MRIVTSLAVVATLLFASQATAETLSKRLPANKTSTLDLYMRWSNDCKNLGTISSGFSKKPGHGTVRPSVVTAPIPSSADFGTAACAGKRIKALRISYTPKKGYRGPDSVTVWVNYGSTGQTSYTYNITVY